MGVAEHDPKMVRAGSARKEFFLPGLPVGCTDASLEAWRSKAELSQVHPQKTQGASRTTADLDIRARHLMPRPEQRRNI